MLLLITKYNLSPKWTQILIFLSIYFFLINVYNFITPDISVAYCITDAEREQLTNLYSQRAILASKIADLNTLKQTVIDEAFHTHSNRVFNNVPYMRQYFPETVVDDTDAALCGERLNWQWIDHINGKIKLTTEDVAANSLEIRQKETQIIETLVNEKLDTIHTRLGNIERALGVETNVNPGSPNSNGTENLTQEPLNPRESCGQRCYNCGYGCGQCVRGFLNACNIS